MRNARETIWAALEIVQITMLSAIRGAVVVWVANLIVALAMIIEYMTLNLSTDSQRFIRTFYASQPFFTFIRS